MDIIIAPVITEKSEYLRNSQNVYVFKVKNTANIEIIGLKPFTDKYTATHPEKAALAPIERSTFPVIKIIA